MSLVSFLVVMILFISFLPCCLQSFETVQKVVEVLLSKHHEEKESSLLDDE